MAVASAPGPAPNPGEEEGEEDNHGEEMHDSQPTPRPARAVRGLVAGGGVQEELASRRHPVVPGPTPGPVLPDGDGWNLIDTMGVWECALTPFFSMEDVPEPYREKWGKVMSRILRVILFAKNMPSLERALKWFLLASQALLRQAKRGGQAGRNCVGVRFNSAMDWRVMGAQITLLQGDLVGEQERRRRLKARGVHPNRGEEKEKSRKTALQTAPPESALQGPDWQVCLPPRLPRRGRHHRPHSNGRPQGEVSSQAQRVA